MTAGGRAPWAAAAARAGACAATGAPGFTSSGCCSIMRSGASISTGDSVSPGAGCAAHMGPQVWLNAGSLCMRSSSGRAHSAADWITVSASVLLSASAAAGRSLQGSGRAAEVGMCRRVSPGRNARAATRRRWPPVFSIFTPDCRRQEGRARKVCDARCLLCA